MNPETIVLFILLSIIAYFLLFIILYAFQGFVVFRLSRFKHLFALFKAAVGALIPMFIIFSYPGLTYWLLQNSIDPIIPLLISEVLFLAILYLAAFSVNLSKTRIKDNFDIFFSIFIIEAEGGAMAWLIKLGEVCLIMTFVMLGVLTVVAPYFGAPFP